MYVYVIPFLICEWALIQCGLFYKHVTHVQSEAKNQRLITFNICSQTIET